MIPRPPTIPGLLWRLASLHPMRSLAVVLALGGTLAALAAGGRAKGAAAGDGCPLEQAWFDGDVHFSQELVLDPDGTGRWTTGGAGSDAPHVRIEFRWQADRSTLTAVAGGERRTAGYEIERREDLCALRFDGVFLPDDAQSRHYTNRR